MYVLLIVLIYVGNSIAIEKVDNLSREQCASMAQDVSKHYNGVSKVIKAYARCIAK